MLFNAVAFTLLKKFTDKEYRACSFLYFAENLKESRFHPMAVQSVFPTTFRQHNSNLIPTKLYTTSYLLFHLLLCTDAMTSYIYRITQILMLTTVTHSNFSSTSKTINQKYTIQCPQQKWQLHITIISAFCSRSFRHQRLSLKWPIYCVGRDVNATHTLTLPLMALTMAKHKPWSLQKRLNNGDVFKTCVDLLYIVQLLQSLRLGLVGHVARLSSDVPANQIFQTCCKTPDGVHPSPD